MASRREIIEETNPSVDNDTIYVAVAKDVKDSKLNLIWAIHHSGGKKICILHIHVPASMIPLMGTKFLPTALTEQEVQAFRKNEWINMHNVLDNHIATCKKMGVRAEKLHIEMNCIEQGIVELISQYKIQKLVMGAASDKYYKKTMTDLRSKKAMHVCEQAPAFCQIQFLCKGYLIHTRHRSLDRGTSSLMQQMPNPEVWHSPSLRSQSISLRQKKYVKLDNPAQESCSRVRIMNVVHGRSTSSEGFPSPQKGKGVRYDKLDGVSQGSPSVCSMCSGGSGSGKNVLSLDLSGLCSIKEDHHHSSPPSVLDGGMDDTLYDQVEQLLAEAEDARRSAYEATLRSFRAEKDAIVARRKFKDSLMLHNEELKLRKELEEALEKAKEEIDNMRNQIEKVNEELQLALEQNSSLENQIVSTELSLKELEQKNMSEADLLQNYKNERDDMQMQRDNALREAEELRRQQGEMSSANTLQNPFSEFSFSEIEEAIHIFNPALKIGEGGYGSIFKGTLRHTEVAIKVLNPDSTQGPSEFQQEVEVLSKLRHPNLVTLIGACPESWTLVYEYLPNGSLEDRLNCKDDSLPLSWQTRIRIATELCSALIFLHTNKPHCIVHGDLKPSNILLDSNLFSKLSDFGISRILSCQKEDSNNNNNSTQFLITNPKGTFAYMDPEFVATGELTPKSDVYSFGIILLRLITGKPALGVITEVQYALDGGKLQTILDPLAEDWPFVLVEQLACLALRCCARNRNSRPDLDSDVWRILEPMRASCEGTNNFGFSSQGIYQPPSCFLCPILQKVMQDPHVAADGFTYEAQAIRGWLETGHDTSPRTNSKLPHFNLVPNHTLRSAIRDWLQNH